MRVTAKKKIAWDLDDTLIDTRYRYTIAKLRCAAIIVEALGGKAPYDPSQLLDELFRRNQRIDTALMEEYGLSPNRFPQSWVMTYREICSEKGVETDTGVERKIKGAASKFRRGPFRATPEAIEALRQLKAAGHELFLITAGEKRLQRRKIRDAGLADFFGDRIYIVDRDKRPVLKKIAESDPKNVIMVGDSKRSDVAAALDVGVHAVWVPTYGYWPADDADVDLKNVSVLDSISDLPEFVRHLVGNGGRMCKCTRKCGQRSSSDSTPDSTEQLG